MASITSKTSIQIDDLINDTIIDGQIVDGHLILRNRIGAEIDAGVVTDGITNLNPLDLMPVGYIYISVDSTDPTELFGGAWVPLAQGRVLVGYVYMSVLSTDPEELFGVGTWVQIGHTLLMDIFVYIWERTA